MKGNSHSQGILVVPIADIPPSILGIGTTVDNTLGVVYISITCRTAKCLGVFGILQVDKDETGFTSAGAWLGADCHSVLLFLVDDDVVG